MGHIVLTCIEVGTKSFHLEFWDVYLVHQDLEARSLNAGRVLLHGRDFAFEVDRESGHSIQFSFVLGERIRCLFILI